MSAFRACGSAVSQPAFSSKYKQFVCAILLGVMGCLLSAVAANAQAVSFPLPTTVGTSSGPLLVNVLVRKSGTLAGVQVLSQGNAALDFQNATAGTTAGTCTTGLSYTAGQTCTASISFSPRFPGLRVGAVVLQAKDGSALGTQAVSGTGVGALSVFVPGEIQTLAGHAAWIYSGDGQTGVNSSIFLPFGIAVDSLGNLYIADSGNNRIRKLTASTGLISTVAGNGTLGSTGDGASALKASLSGPTSVALDGAGNLYVTDSGNNVIREIYAGTGLIATIAGKIGQFGFTGDGGPATAATLNSPNGITLDPSGNLYIADTANNAVRRVDALTGVMTTVAGTGVSGYNGDNIAATTARLASPWSISASADGSFLIADQGNHRVRKLGKDGNLTTVIGTGSATYSGDGALATLAALNAPASAIADVAGNIYVADSGNNRIRKINATTGIVTTVAGSTSQSISGDSGPATNAGLYGPYTLALDGPGNLYIADVFHNRVRLLSANLAILDYLPMRIGRVAPVQTQTIENDGNLPLNVSLVQAVSDSVIDGQTTTCTSGLALAPLGSCAIGAAFAPTQLGTPLVGTILLRSDAVNAPGTLNLSGNVLSEDPSTVTLSASANPVQAGDPVIFIATATSVGVIPTGQFTLFDGATPLATQNLQSGGIATFNLNTLTGGQHSITASYSGDTNNTPGVSLPLIEVVQDISAPTQTTLGVNANPTLAGSAVTFTAAVSVTTPGSGTGEITGTVTFTDGTIIIGAATVHGGNATITVPNLTVGTHSVVASYSGISAYGASTSAPFVVTIQAGTTATLLTSSATPAAGGAALLLSATVTSNGMMPTGNVLFMDGSTPLGLAPLNQSGTTTLQLPGTTLAVGTHPIIAIYSGDMLNLGSSSTPLAEIVNLAVATAVITSSSSPSSQGAPVILTATLTSTGGIPSGTVEFFDGTLSLGTATLDPTGAATFTTATFGLGTHPITVHYAGDPLDDVTTSAIFNEVVIPATTTIAFTSTANPAVVGTPNVFTINVQGTGAQPSGTITLQDNGTTLGVQPLDPTGTTLFPNTNLAIGIHNLVALYSGDADHAPNFTNLTQRVIQVTSTALSSSSQTAIAGTQVNWTAVVTGLSGQPVTGTVQFSDGAAQVANVPVNANGVATFTSPSLSLGAHPMLAVYSGDPLDQASTSTPLLQTIQIGTTSVLFSASANPAFAGTSVDLNATVSGNGVTPTGSVVFSDAGTILLRVPLTASGTASLPLSTLTPGTHLLTASYSGDANNGPSTSAAYSESIVQQTVLTTYSSANPSMFQDSVTITVTVSGGLPAYPATGAVTLSDGASIIGTANVDALGSVHFPFTTLALGQHVLTATYAGDTRNSPAASATFTQNVILRPTNDGFSTTATNLSAGQQVTFISLVQGVGPYFPTGTVTFVSGTTVLGTATLSPTGLATLTFVPLQGVYSVVAQYPGDSLFAASNSAPTAVTVGPTVEFTMNMTPSTLTLASGDHKTLQIQIVTASTFTDTLNIGCAGLPIDATCTFSTNSVKIAGGSTTNLTVVLDTGTPLGAGPVAGLASSRNAPLACLFPAAVLLLLTLAQTRRFRKQLSGLLMILLLATMATLTGCGNSLTVNHTPAGTYLFQIIGTGTTSGATQSGTVVLMVTQ